MCVRRCLDFSFRRLWSRHLCCTGTFPHRPGDRRIAGRERGHHQDPSAPRPPQAARDLCRSAAPFLKARTAFLAANPSLWRKCRRMTRCNRSRVITETEPVESDCRDSRNQYGCADDEQAPPLRLLLLQFLNLPLPPLALAEKVADSSGVNVGHLSHSADVDLLFTLSGLDNVVGCLHAHECVHSRSKSLLKAKRHVAGKVGLAVEQAGKSRPGHPRRAAAAVTDSPAGSMISVRIKSPGWGGFFIGMVLAQE